MKYQVVITVGGRWRIYFHPIPGHLYCISGDSASGQPGRNGSALHVLNVNLNRIEAVFDANVPPEELALEAYKMGHYYDTATIAVEAMFHGLVVNYRLGQEMNPPYPMLFQHDNSFTSDKSVTSHTFGWKQTEQNRELIISLLQTDLAYNLSKKPHERALALKCWDIPTLRQTSTVLRNKRGKPEAQSGKCDDLFMSLGIANAVGHTLRGNIQTPSIEKEPTIFEAWMKEKEVLASVEPNVSFGEIESVEGAVFADYN